MNAPKVITSLTNDRVKAIRALEMRKVRKETGLFAAEGAALLVTARDNGFKPETLVYQAGTNRKRHRQGARHLGAERGRGSARSLGPGAGQARLEGQSADHDRRLSPALRAPPKPATLEKSMTWLALEEVRDPGNLGTIIRTSDAVGVAGIILVGACCDPYSLEAIRATMGSIFSVPIVPHRARGVSRPRQGLARRRRRDRFFGARRLSQRQLSRSRTPGHGKRGPRAFRSTGAGGDAARQDPDVGATRQPQPRDRDGADAVSDPRPPPEALVPPSPIEKF